MLASGLNLLISSSRPLTALRYDDSPPTTCSPSDTSPPAAAVMDRGSMDPSHEDYICTRGSELRLKAISLRRDIMSVIAYPIANENLSTVRNGLVDGDCDVALLIVQV